MSNLAQAARGRQHLSKFLKVTVQQIDGDLEDDLILRRLEHLAVAWRHQLDGASQAGTRAA